MNKPILTETLASARVSRGPLDKIDLLELQDFLWRHRKNILFTALAIVAITFVVLLMMTPRYTATAQVFLQPRKEKILGSEQIVTELNLETSNVDSQVSVIESTNLLHRVVVKENLTSDPEFNKEAGLLAFISGFFGSGDESNGGLKEGNEIPEDALNAIRNLRDALGVERVKRTLVLSISVTSRDRAKAARLANAVANAFVEDQVEARYEAAKHASVWLSERIEELGQQVRKSEEEVAKYRRENNLVATSSEGNTTITEQQLSELNEKLIIARADVAEKRAKYEQAKKVIQQGGDIQGIPEAVRSESITKLREQQAEVTRREADISARYGSRHPLLINVRAESRDINRSIAAEVQRILLNLKNEYEVADARERSLEASLDEVTGKTGIDNNVGVRLRELERINAANKTIFENFLSRAKITQEQSSFEEREARVISPATNPSRPSSPKKALSLGIATIIGVLLGIASSVALDRLNPGYMTAQEVEEKLGYPVLASVPLLGSDELRIGNTVMDAATYLQEKPLSRYAEAIRGVRVGIQVAAVDNPPRTILLTSSVAGEGKSTLARSIAASSSKSGHKVLLIDADLRHPSTSKFFRLENAPGLVDLLAGQVSLAGTVSAQSGFAILPAGRKSQNPLDLLSSDRMRQLIEKLSSEYDYIIVDSPPLEPVIDARVLSGLIDVVVFVVRWQSTPRESVARNAEIFASSRKLAGIVMNGVDESKTPRYGAYAQYPTYYHRKYYQN